MKFCLLLIGIFSFQILNSQISHYVTGEILSQPAAGKMYIKQGTYQLLNANYGIILATPSQGATCKNFIQIPVIQLKQDEEDSGTPIFLLNGGPGNSNLWENHIPVSLLEHHPLIMVGYRGVDGSIVLNSIKLNKLLSGTENFLSDQQVIQEVSHFRDSICRAYGPGSFTLKKIAEDIERVRMALGYEKISFYAFSFGGMVALQYIELYPERVISAILLGSRSPDNYYLNSNCSDSILHKIDKKFYSVNSTTSFSERVWPFLSKDCLNPPCDKMKLALFRHLYSFELTNSLNQKLISGSVSSSYFTDFFNSSFIEKLNIGDMVLKLPYLEISNQPIQSTSGIIDELTLTMNQWTTFISNPDYKTNRKDSSLTYSTRILWISGELDIISPPCLYEFIQKAYPNSTQIVIPDCFHVDLLKAEETIRDQIIDFYGE